MKSINFALEISNSIVRVTFIMIKVLIYVVVSLLINGMVIGESFWHLVASMRIDGLSVLSDIYDNLSVMQVWVIGICELILMLCLLVPKGDDAKGMDEKDLKK